MNRNETMNDVQINSTANGYVVRRAPDFHSDRSQPISECHVFETFDALVAFLRFVMPVHVKVEPQPVPPVIRTPARRRAI